MVTLAKLVPRERWAALLVNGTPITVVIHENLDVPKDLCDGHLFVRADFEEQSGVVHVQYHSTKTGEPVGDGITIRI
jgi:hypothetical protein